MSLIKFLKHLAYIAAIHPLSYLLGLLSSGIVAFILSIICVSRDIDFNLSAQYNAVILTIMPLLFFCIFMFINGIKSESFVPGIILLVSLTVFLVQHILLFYNYDKALFIGSCQSLAYAIYTDQSGPSATLIHTILLVLQCLVHLPLFMIANYCGHRYQLYIQKKYQN